MTHFKTTFQNTVAASLLLSVVACGLAGCVGAAVNTTSIAVKSAPRSELRPLAEAGDAVAQFKLGQSYCCMGPGFDTQIATEWYCKAARQGNADAMYELGRVYLGDVSRTPAPGQKLLRAVAAKRDNANGYLWLSRAAAREHRDATVKLENLQQTISDGDLKKARRLDALGASVPCEYSEVFGS